MSKLFVGVDVGNKGAIVLMNEAREIVDLMTMPLFEIQFGKGPKNKKRNFTDNLKVYNFLLKYSNMGYDMVFGMEIIFHGKSGYSSLNAGIAYGLLWAAIEHFGEVKFFTPKVWWKNMYEAYAHIIPKMDTVGLDKFEETKIIPIGLTRYFFSNDILLPTKRTTKPNDGIADAIWIADYLRRGNEY